MRTTLDIDDDVLAAAKELASGQKTTAGRVISDLVRKALTESSSKKLRYRNGFAVLPKRGGGVVTPELVDRLAEDEL
jgi:Arc/MetJ family transcription regulator